MERIAVGTLLFGPGERLNHLRILVQASAPTAPARQLEDLDELGEERSDEGILLIDADVLPSEDVGYLRRFLARQPQFQLTLVGEDSSRRVARSLLRLPRVQWLGWPPDLDDVRHLVDPSGAATPSAARTQERPPELRELPERRELKRRAPAEHAREPREAASAGEAGDELARIEAILDLPDMPDSPEMPDMDAPTSPAASDARGARADSGLSAPPAYFRDQVADLADIAQRIEGGVAGLRDAGVPDGPGGAGGGDVDALSGDVARLVQFTRTLSYLTAAPPRGDQVFDLSELVETLVAGLPKKGAQSPRWMARSSGPLLVSSDRELLLQVFDALLYVAEKCSVRGEIVRVQVAEAKGAGPRRANVSIEFSAGPLASFEPAQVIEPYAIRRVLPDLGPNALSAARGIVAGQGGRLELQSSGRGRMIWLLEMPTVPTPVAASAPERKRPEGPERKRPEAPESASPGHPSRGAADPFA
jgi:hypothetical protein